MHSKQDYYRFFEQVACWERKMIYSVMDAMNEVQDDYVLGILRRVAGEEMKHYSMILDLLQLKFLSEGSGRDRRLVNRMSALGMVHLTPEVRMSGPERDAYCVDMTFRGMCFESTHRFTNGEKFRAQVSLFDNPNVETASGKIAWVKEILPGFFMTGMQFDV